MERERVLQLYRENTKAKQQIYRGIVNRAGSRELNNFLKQNKEELKFQVLLNLQKIKMFSL
ncbi:hypothetical protein pb186bvf_004929 [Paramecium bursaria]